MNILIKTAGAATPTACTIGVPHKGAAHFLLGNRPLRCQLKGGLFPFVVGQYGYDQQTESQHQRKCFVHCHDLTPFLQGMSRPPLRSRFYCTWKIITRAHPSWMCFFIGAERQPLSATPSWTNPHSPLSGRNGLTRAFAIMPAFPHLKNSWQRSSDGKHRVPDPVHSHRPFN